MFNTISIEFDSEKELKSSIGEVEALTTKRNISEVICSEQRRGAYAALWGQTQEEAANKAAGQDNVPFNEVCGLWKERERWTKLVSAQKAGMREDTSNLACLPLCVNSQSVSFHFVFLSAVLFLGKS